VGSTVDVTDDVALVIPVVVVVAASTRSRVRTG